MTSEKKIIKETEFYASLKEFSRHTAIPWFKCFFNPRFSYIERIVMSVILSVGFVYASTLVYELSRIVLSFPLITNIESLQHPAWEQPFPTIYICPLNRISKDLIVKQVDKWVLPNNITKNEILDKLRSIPNGAYRLANFEYSEMIAGIMAMNNISVERLINEITLPCDKMISFCQWRSIDIDCREVFVPVNTVDGTCCAFNYINPNRDNNRTSTRKMSGSGFNSGLRAALFINYSDTFSSLSSSRGYFINAGAPGSFVNARALGRMLQRNTANFYSFTSSRIESSKAVMELPKIHRGCSARDRKLAAFKTYTVSNCKAECIFNLSLASCHCIPFIAPKYSDDQRYCEFSDMKCLETIRDAMMYITSGNNLNRVTESRFKIEQNPRPCFCYPSCEADYNFDVSFSSSPLNMRQTNTDRKSGEYEKMEFYCDVYVYSQGNMLTKIVTDVKYDPTELLGYLGTIASFTMGWLFLLIFRISWNNSIIHYGMEHYLCNRNITFCGSISN